MTDCLYSIRMRASLNGAHISGAERLVGEHELQPVAAELIARARNHPRGIPDSITVTVDSLDGKEIVRLPALPVRTIEVGDFKAGRDEAVALLVEAGVSEAAARTALNSIVSGASPADGNMRGAMIVDAATGARLEPDRAKGVRARAVDYDPALMAELPDILKRHGLESTRIKDALAVATKVSSAPGAVAELCISDDPDYTTGYAASPRIGYVRITRLKEPGDLSGGRAFFVDTRGFNLEDYTDYLRNVPVLVTGPVEIPIPPHPCPSPTCGGRDIKEEGYV